MIAEPLEHLLTQLHIHEADPPPRSEGALAALVAAYLRAHGWDVAELVPCAAGEADLVARRGGATVILETKFRLDRRAVLSGCAQLLLYRQAIDPAADLIITGFATAHTPALTAQAALLGVTVVGIRNDEHGGRKARPSAFSVQPSALTWNVQSLARARGITSAPQLAAVVGLSKQAVYPIWRGEVVQISVATLGKLCLGLDARCGDWFLWEGQGDARRLVWNIAVAAERVGLSTQQLAFRSGIYFRMMRLYALGTAQSTFVATLGKLAQALTADGQPFDIGELFVWSGTQCGELNAEG